MLRRIASGFTLVAVVFGLGIVVGQRAAVSAQAKNHIYEIRTYTAAEGKLPALLKRFRDYELPIFEKNGMHAILYSVAAEAPLSENTFVYILEHEGRDSARKGWAGFLADPAFRAAVQESDAGGRAVVKVDTVFVNPTDFSPLR
ncbi:MAG: NIPSNAP family protein [Vicinamibacterales bacterium]